MKNLSHDSQTSAWDLNLGPPQHKAKKELNCHSQSDHFPLDCCNPTGCINVFLFYGMAACSQALASFKWCLQTCLSIEILYPSFFIFKISLLSTSTALTHLLLGYPKGLFPIMLLSRIHFGTHFSSLCWTWYAYDSLFNLIIIDILHSSNCLHNSLLYAILYVLFSFIGPSILLNTFLSNISIVDYDFLARIQVSLVYHNTSFITVLHSFTFVSWLSHDGLQ